MSLIFDALQRMGHHDDSLKKKQEGSSAKRHAYTLRRVFFSPSVLLMVSGGIFLAGFLTVQITQSLSERIASTPSTTHKVALPVDYPEPTGQGNAVLSDQPDSDRIPAEELADISFHPMGERQVETLASGDSNNSFQVHFFAPEQQGADPLKPADHVADERKVDSSSNPLDNSTQSIEIEAVQGEATVVPVDDYPKITKSNVSASVVKLSLPPPLKSDVKKKPVQNEKKQASEAMPPTISSAVHDHIAAQARNHLEMAQLVAKIKAAIQSEDHSHTDELFKTLEARLEPGSLFVLRLKAYREIRRGNLEKARRLLVRVLSQKPEDRESGLNMAVIEMRSGQFNDAYRRLSDLHNLYPEDHRITLSLDESLKMVSRVRAGDDLKTVARD